MVERKGEDTLSRRRFLGGLGALGFTTGVIALLEARRENLFPYHSSSEITDLKEREKGPGSMLFGVYPEMWPELDPNYPFPGADLKKLEERLGQPIHLVGLFGNLYQPYFLNYLRDVEAIGAIPVISLLLNPPGPENYLPLKSLSKGKHDQALRRIAQGVSGEIPVILRFGYEMNGMWFPHGAIGDNQPDDFIDAWRYSREFFEKMKVRNVRWAFSPSVLSPMAPFFPGEGWADLIAPDGYDLYLNEHPITQVTRRSFFQYLASYLYFPNLSFIEVFGPTLAEAQKIAPEVPLMIGEISSGRTFGQGEWLAKAFSRASKFANAIICFDYDKAHLIAQNLGERNWRLDKNPETMLKLKEVLKRNIWAKDLSPQEIMERLLRV